MAVKDVRAYFLVDALSLGPQGLAHAANALLSFSSIAAFAASPEPAHLGLCCLRPGRGGQRGHKLEVGGAIAMAA